MQNNGSVEIVESDAGGLSRGGGFGERRTVIHSTSEDQGSRTKDVLDVQLPAGSQVKITRPDGTIVEAVIGEPGGVLTSTATRVVKPTTWDSVGQTTERVVLPGKERGHFPRTAMVTIRHGKRDDPLGLLPEGARELLSKAAGIETGADNIWDFLRGGRVTRYVVADITSFDGLKDPLRSLVESGRVDVDKIPDDYGTFRGLRKIPRLV